MQEHRTIRDTKCQYQDRECHNAFELEMSDVYVASPECYT